MVGLSLSDTTEKTSGRRGAGVGQTIFHPLDVRGKLSAMCREAYREVTLVGAHAGTSGESLSWWRRKDRRWEKISDDTPDTKKPPPAVCVCLASGRSGKLPKNNNQPLPSRLFDGSARSSPQRSYFFCGARPIDQEVMSSIDAIRGAPIHKPRGQRVCVSTRSRTRTILSPTRRPTPEPRLFFFNPP